MGLPGFTAVCLVSDGVCPPPTLIRSRQAARHGVTPAANGFDPIEIDPLDDIARRLSEESEREFEDEFQRQAWEYAQRETEEDIAGLATDFGDLALAVGIGIVVGGAGGLWIEQKLLPTAPMPGRPTPGCITNPIAPRMRTINDSSWGCERGLVNAQLAADAVCASIPGQCSSTGPTEIPLHGPAHHGSGNADSIAGLAWFLVQYQFRLYLRVRLTRFSPASPGAGLHSPPTSPESPDEPPQG